MLTHPRTADEPLEPAGQAKLRIPGWKLGYITFVLDWSALDRDISGKITMKANTTDTPIEQIVDALRETEGDHDQSSVSYFADSDGWEFIHNNPRVIKGAGAPRVTEYELRRIMDNPYEATDDFTPERINQIYGYIYAVENSTSSADLELDRLAQGEYGDSALYHIANIIGTRLSSDQAAIVGEVAGNPIYELLLYRYVDHPQLFEYGVTQSRIYLYLVEETEG